jgi:hypothetical protein
MRFFGDNEEFGVNIAIFLLHVNVDLLVPCVSDYPQSMFVLNSLCSVSSFAWLYIST